MTVFLFPFFIIHCVVISISKGEWSSKRRKAIEVLIFWLAVTLPYDAAIAYGGLPVLIVYGIYLACVLFAVAVKMYNECD